MASIEFIVSYASREDWQNGKPEAAEIREYDNRGRLESTRAIPLSRVPMGGDWSEVDDGEQFRTVQLTPRLKSHHTNRTRAPAMTGAFRFVPTENL